MNRRRKAKKARKLWDYYFYKKHSCKGSEVCLDKCEEIDRRVRGEDKW